MSCTLRPRSGTSLLNRADGMRGDGNTQPQGKPVFHIKIGESTPIATEGPQNITWGLIPKASAGTDYERNNNPFLRWSHTRWCVSTSTCLCLFRRVLLKHAVSRTTKSVTSRRVPQGAHATRSREKASRGHHGNFAHRALCVAGTQGEAAPLAQ